VEQREIGLLLRQHGQEISEGGKDCQAHAPAITAVRTKQHHLPDGTRRWHAGREFALHGFGDDKAEVVGEAVMESSAPMRCRISVAESRLHPNLRATHFDGAGRHVVGPQIEGAADARLHPTRSVAPVRPVVST
jgi:hypothetical protein